MEKLQFIRIFDPYLIPEYLITQIKDREFDADRFYKYQETICTYMEGDKRIVNPCNLLVVLADTDKKIQGFVWAVIDLLNGNLCINNYSINKNYWGKGRAVEWLKDWSLEIQRGAKLKKIFWITKATKYCEKHGFSKSKNVLYEYIEEKKDQDDGEDTLRNSCETDRRSELTKPGTTKLSESDTGVDGSSSGTIISESVAAI